VLPDVSAFTGSESDMKHMVLDDSDRKDTSVMDKVRKMALLIQADLRLCPLQRVKYKFCFTAAQPCLHRATNEVNN
jgi:predicted metal-dependent hydrolase